MKAYRARKSKTPFILYQSTHKLRFIGQLQAPVLHLQRNICSFVYSITLWRWGLVTCHFRMFCTVFWHDNCEWYVWQYAVWSWPTYGVRVERLRNTTQSAYPRLGLVTSRIRSKPDNHYGRYPFDNSRAHWTEAPLCPQRGLNTGSPASY
jgi:hypothetical protein